MKRIPQKEQTKLLAAVEAAISDPLGASIKLTATNPPVFRLRVGEYRVFFMLDGERKIMKVTTVLRRTSKTY